MHDGETDQPLSLALNSLSPTPSSVLLELLVEHDRSVGPLAHVAVRADTMDTTELALLAAMHGESANIPQPVADAVARANAARLQWRALAAVAAGQRDDAIRLLRAAAARLTEIHERDLAAAALREAVSLEQSGNTTRLGTKELTYATRQLGRS
jgi:hypothetical protein